MTARPQGPLELMHLSSGTSNQHEGAWGPLSYESASVRREREAGIETSPHAPAMVIPSMRTVGGKVSNVLSNVANAMG